MKISVVIPNHNGGAALTRCLDGVRASSYENFECIVVDDCSTDRSVETLRGSAIRVIELHDGPNGPAYARNAGAQAASGDIVLFLDADVVIYPDTLQKIAANFSQEEGLTAVFGSYDEQPGDGHFLSQYKNLFHHFVHQKAKRQSRSFWSGCGAIRRDAFLAIGGFDSVKYPQPSIEDIDLGRRLTAQGGRIVLDNTIQVKHLKRWTLKNLIVTDIFSRGIPWTQLILADRSIPDDLNLETSQRWSAMLVGVLLMMIALGAFFFRGTLLLPIVMTLFLLTLGFWQWDAQGLRFESDWKAGLRFAAAYALLTALALWSGYAFLLPFALALLLLALIVLGLARTSQFLKQAAFALMVAAPVVMTLQIFLALPLWWNAVTVVLFGLFIYLNRKFYSFFVQKRGVVFALAVAPFHMLYFLYSVVAFAGGALKYFWRARSPVAYEPTRSKG